MHLRKWEDFELLLEDLFRSQIRVIENRVLCLEAVNSYLSESKEG